MCSSVVTTAIQPVPKVTAAAFLPSGSVSSAGSCGAGAVNAWGMRVTINPTTVMTPPIMVSVSRITSHFRSRRLGGSATASAASGGVGSGMDDTFDDEETGGTDGSLSVTIGEDAPSRLDKALAAAMPEEAALSRSRLMRMIAEGAVSRDGVAVIDPKARVLAGEVYILRLDPAQPVETLAEDIPLVVVWEDADLVVIDKPAGMVVHPAPGSPSGTLVNALLAHCGDSLSGIGGERRPGIVHRIDKDTTGLLVVAKSDRAHHGLARQFEDHSVTRHYLAVVHGVPSGADPRLRGLRGVSFEAGGILKIATGLARHKTDRQRQAVVWEGGRHAVTRVRVVEEFAAQAALVDCWLETGRTHQIRVHLAYAGHGLVGDQTYGGKKRLSEKALGPGAGVGNTFPRQALHAASLGFNHPVTGERLEFTSPLPEDMARLIAALRGG
jgi:23S rRNA pseudouridine1911/1915/1917 synthase